MKYYLIEGDLPQGNGLVISETELTDKQVIEKFKSDALNENKLIDTCGFIETVANSLTVTELDYIVK